MNQQKFTPECIESLNEKEVFVFGSNMNGNHAGGAARTAVEKFGAVMGQAEGLQGQSYAIPTLDENMDKVDAEFLASNISYLISAIDEGEILFVNCTYVKFSFGYTKRTMEFDVKEIVLGKGNPSWGAPNEIVFIIKLGRRVAWK